MVARNSGRDLESSLRSSTSALPRANILGCEIDRLDLDATVRRSETLILQGSPTQHMAINVAKLVKLRTDARLREIVESCQLVNADGQGIVWASRLLGDPLPERVAGIDLMHRILSLAELRGFRVFILGATADVLERAVCKLREAHPRLTIAGYRDGYFADGEVADVCVAIRQAHPDILLVAMSSPRKEYFLGANSHLLGVPFQMGVGGAIDVVAGMTRRAPAAWQRLGLEWLFRLLQEPRRLAPRYLRTNAAFAVLLARELWHRRLARADAWNWSKRP
jgi:N-acetylglucosaminyldiphosphoundecaprenol N-acetyl-beta-D-mannosaminyltransferase